MYLYSELIFNNTYYYKDDAQNIKVFMLRVLYSKNNV